MLYQLLTLSPSGPRLGDIASLSDTAFICDVVVGRNRGGTNPLTYSTLVRSLKKGFALDKLQVQALNSNRAFITAFMAKREEQISPCLYM